MPDPTMLTDAHQPPYAGGHPIARLAAEALDHLWPWTGAGFRTSRTLQALGVGAAWLATTVWVLAAMGKLAAPYVIGWWVLWSIVEIFLRLSSKPYVKEGRWWGARYRKAGWMDMLCYVAFKNLLIGAVLFLSLKALGLLAV